MQFSFKNKQIKEICEKRVVAQAKLGANGARKLATRLSELLAAKCVGELVAGSPHPLTGDRVGQFAVSLDGGKRLVFEPNDDVTPLNEDGGGTWPAVSRVRIMFIGDYHG
jgi:proteic killer suppression protein